MRKHTQKKLSKSFQYDKIEIIVSSRKVYNVLIQHVEYYSTMHGDTGPLLSVSHWCWK